MPAKIESSDLVEDLQSVTAELKKPPTKAEYRKHGEFAPCTIARRFDGWNEALREIDAGVNKPTTLDEDDLLTEIRSLADELGRSPSRSEMNEHGEYSGSAYVRAFGNWNEALEAAGFEGNDAGHRSEYRKLARESLIEDLEHVCEQYGRTPSKTEYVESGEYSIQPYLTEFGSWADAVRAVGYTPYRQPGETNDSETLRPPTRPTPSETDLVRELRSLYNHLGHTPTQEELALHESRTPKPYRREFGSWTAALAAAGLEPVKHAKLEQETLLEEIRGLAEQLDRPPSYGDMERFGKFAPETYFSRFETWRAAVEAAGLEYSHPLSGENNPSWEGGVTIRYGNNWPSQRRAAIERDSMECVVCGMGRGAHREKYGFDLHVHHRRPRREYIEADDLTLEDANKLSNLITLCAKHHARWERLPVQPLPN